MDNACFAWSLLCTRLKKMRIGNRILRALDCTYSHSLLSWGFATMLCDPLSRNSSNDVTLYDSVESHEHWISNDFIRHFQIWTFEHDMLINVYNIENVYNIDKPVLSLQLISGKKKRQRAIHARFTWRWCRAFYVDKKSIVRLQITRNKNKKFFCDR